MRFNIILFAIIFLNTYSFGQLSEKQLEKLGMNPILFLDSVETDLENLKTISPFNISNIDIMSKKKVEKYFGDRGFDGAVYVTTVQAAKKKYWNFLRNKSPEYKEIVNSPQADTIVQYIVNGETLSEGAAPGTLFSISDHHFKNMRIIDTKKNEPQNISLKRYLVVIKARKVKGRVKTEKK